MIMAVTDVLFSGLISATTNGDSVANPQTDASGRSGVMDFSAYRELAVFVQLKTMTAGTSPTAQVIVASADTQATPYVANLNSDAPAWTAAVNQYRTSIGPGTSHNDSLASNGRFLWIITGAPATCTFWVHIEGKR